MAKEKGNIFDLKLFSKLMVFVKPYKKVFYFVMTAAILLAVFSALTPYLLKIVVDDYIRLKDYDGMVFIIGMMLVTLLSEVLFQFLFVQSLQIWQLQFLTVCLNLKYLYLF